MCVIVLFICFSNQSTGWTPLTCASSEGHVQIVEYLLDKKADVDGKCSPDQRKYGSGKNVSKFLGI